MTHCYTSGFVSTHSRPKAAAPPAKSSQSLRQFQHTAARRRLFTKSGAGKTGSEFQHTAARRRLESPVTLQGFKPVSTHSRPKAAGYLRPARLRHCRVSTHSRPKAAACDLVVCQLVRLFQHTAARRRLLKWESASVKTDAFQHTAARRRLLKFVLEMKH